MFEGNLVVDAVAHAYDWSDSNRADSCDAATYRRQGAYVHELYHLQCESPEPGYRLSRKEFTSQWTAEAMANCYFLESDIDLVIFHSVQIPAHYKHGLSRWDIGLKLRDIAPGRVLLYGCVDSFQPDHGRIFDEMAQLAADGAVGFKFYPASGFFDPTTRQPITMAYDTPERAFPIFERARELGVRHVAFHKAQPLAGALRAVRVEDVAGAAAAFRDMTFEVVHAGWAFLEEVGLLLRAYPNVYANLESVVNLVVNAPDRFAHVIGHLLLSGGEDRILFATGAILNHPDPVVRKFMEFQIPDELCRGYGYPKLTAEMKAKILAINALRLLEVDTASLKDTVASDAWAQRRAAGKEAPWTAHRNLLASGRYTAETIGHD